jgi:hypothetical protein
MTAAEKVFNALATARNELRPGEPLTKAIWLDVAGEAIDLIVKDALAAALPAPRPRAKTGEPRPRNLLFDALAASCGWNPQKMTRVASKVVAVALAEIREADPEVTPEQIAQNARTYRSRHPTWPLTPTALSKNWAEFTGNAPPPGLPSAEPQDWRARWAEVTDPDHAYLRIDDARYIESWGAATAQQRSEITSRIGAGRR